MRTRVLPGNGNTNRFIDEKNEFRQFKHDELSAFKDREINIERVKDELMDENMALIESTNQLRTRVAELLGSRFHAGSDEGNAKVNEELREELRKANMEISRLQEAVESNPKLTEALIDAEEAEADRYKKLYQSACSERDHVIRKNDSLKQSLHDARLTMSTVPASWSRVSTRATVPASPSAVPPTTLVPRTTALTGKTPSFAVSISTPMGTPKASSTTKNHDPALPPPPSPSVNNAISNQTNSEIDDLREKLRRSEERAQQNYDEMKEYQSWLEQVEEGQESLKDSKAPEFEPVPDNPPGLWERKDGKDASVANSDAGQDGKDWVTRISRKEHEKVTVKPWPKCQDLDVWRSNVVQAVCVRQVIQTRLHGEDGYLLLYYPVQIMLSLPIQENSVSSPLTPSCPLPCRTWWTPLARRHRRSRFGSDRGVKSWEKKGIFLMGREILAMVLDHFRTTSKDEVLFNASHIYKLQYRGDKEMDKFPPCLD